jgi:hypothetical protein
VPTLTLEWRGRLRDILLWTFRCHRGNQTAKPRRLWQARHRLGTRSGLNSKIKCPTALGRTLPLYGLTWKLGELGTSANCCEGTHDK